jgi:hypothetical protein
MSIENARLAYPVLVRVAKEQSRAVRERRGNTWLTYDDLCRLLTEVGMNETPRTVVPKVLRDLQAACIEKGMPDLTSLVIQKPRNRADSGDLVRPSDAWWAAYVERGEAAAGDVGFWFGHYRAARDYAEWPEAPFF